MNATLLNASQFFFGFSVAFYLGYAYFGVEKLLVRLKG